MKPKLYFLYTVWSCEWNFKCTTSRWLKQRDSMTMVFERLWQCFLGFVYEGSFQCLLDCLHVEPVTHVQSSFIMRCWKLGSVEAREIMFSVTCFRWSFWTKLSCVRASRATTYFKSKWSMITLWTDLKHMLTSWANSNTTNSEPQLIDCIDVCVVLREWRLTRTWQFNYKFLVLFEYFLSFIWPFFWHTWFTVGVLQYEQRISTRNVDTKLKRNSLFY